MEERHAIKSRILTLMPRVSTATLESVERFLKERVEDGQGLQNRNPSGSQTAGPCPRCHGVRPPHDSAAPWHMRQNAHNVLMARGALCAPCEWLKRNLSKTREEWPHWEAFNAHKSNGDSEQFKIPSQDAGISRGVKRNYGEKC